MQHKTILLVSPSHMGLYRDILTGLTDLGFKTECITRSIPKDPFSLIEKRNKYIYSKKKFLEKLEKMWLQLYYSGDYSFNYDYLLVINGAFVHPILFELLREKNPNIIAINYLFDTTKVYQYERNFKYYDAIFSFDRHDVNKYGLNLLPIYWVPSDEKLEVKYDLWGFGSYKRTRYIIFKKLKDKANALALNSYIKLFDSTKGLNWKGKIGRRLRILSLINVYDEDIFCSESISPDEFRKCILSSRIILDTKLLEQDGLTARFMWALGAGKKIITNNESAKCYPFYSEEQICIINDKRLVIPTSFLSDQYCMPKDVREIIDTYRIDNWLRRLLNIEK